VSNLVVSQFDPLSGWGPVTPVLQSESFYTAPTMDTFADGRIVFAWAEHTNNQYIVKIAERAAAGQWGPTTTVSSKDSSAYDADISGIAIKAMPNGDLFLAWNENQRDSGTPPYKLHRLFVAKRTANKWSPPYAVDPAGIGDVSEPRFRLDPNGNALLLWSEWQFINGASDNWSWGVICQ
jgi:hypothetical protein